MSIKRITQQIGKTKGNTSLFVPILLTMILMCSCSKEQEHPIPTPSHTVICYLGGNNNLSASIQSQINELQAGYKSSSTNVLVYIALPSGAKLLQLNVKAEPTLITQYDSGRSSSSEMLSEVIATCRRISPTKTYTLIVSSHGSGWLPVGMLQNPQGTPLGRSIIADNDANPNEMELSDFARAIPDGVFDAIVLESCLMGGVEVAYALHSKAKYLLVAPAELLDPGFTPIYRNAFQTLCVTNTDIRLRLITFAEQYMSYINNLSGNHRSATLSVIDLEQIEPLAEIFARHIGQLPISSQEQLASIQHFDRPGKYGDKLALARFFDLEDAAQRFIKGAEGVDELTHTLENVVIWKAHSTTFMLSMGGFTIDRYCGLTTYIPQEELPVLNAAYRSTAWWQRITKETL